jgi:hypothetical protein
LAASSPAAVEKFTPERLADLIEQHGQDVLNTLAAALRNMSSNQTEPGSSSAGEADESGRTGDVASSVRTWNQVGVIEGFEHVWPEVHEHYGPMTVWEGRDEQGPVRLAIGRPAERLHLYGRERGWVSVWEVVNGQPREQRANFIDTDDFETTGERIAVISGRDGGKKAMFAPGDEHLLPPVYRDMRIEVQRDRCNGPYAKNRLGVVATDGDGDLDVMLNHALAHLRLRS